jgi:hypothetical protein
LSVTTEVMEIISHHLDPKTQAEAIAKIRKWIVLRGISVPSGLNN